MQVFLKASIAYILPSMHTLTCRQSRFKPTFAIGFHSFNSSLNECCDYR